MPQAPIVYARRNIDETKLSEPIQTGRRRSSKRTSSTQARVTRREDLPLPVRQTLYYQSVVCQPSIRKRLRMYHAYLHAGEAFVSIVRSCIDEAGEEEADE